MTLQIKCRRTVRRKAKGLAIVEMTIVLPLFLLLVMGVFELSRALLANNIIVNMSREGASLVARTSWTTPQNIMSALSDTASPLEMKDHGRIYVTVVVGRSGNDPYVLEQHQWTSSGYNKSSRIWSDCDNWQADGSCAMPDTPPKLTDFNMVLGEGETVHVVEVFYDYDNVLKYAIKNNLELYSHTLL